MNLRGAVASLVRLRHRKAIERVLQEGRSWSNALLKLKAAPNDEGIIRVAVIAGRRAIGKAVQRNRAKRLLREAARLHLHEIRPGWDLVLIARPGLIGRKRQDAEAALLEGLARLGLLREEGSPPSGNSGLPHGTLGNPFGS